VRPFIICIFVVIAGLLLPAGEAAAFVSAAAAGRGAVTPAVPASGTDERSIHPKQLWSYEAGG
jgi:hypothetical protein